MSNNRPRGREREVSGPGKSVRKRGDGLGTGPVGGAGRSEQGGNGRQSSGSRGAGARGGGGMKLIVLLLALLLGGGGGMTALLGGQSGGGGGGVSSAPPSQQVSPGGGTDWAEALSGLGGGSVSSGWQSGANTGRLDSSVAPGARAKYTQLLGGGKDTVTLMVYMCGTDLESRSGMGTSDLQEMLDARFGSSVNLLVYTGGCKGWKNNVVSSSANQIWQVKDGKLASLEKNLGSVSMTDPNTLSGYIRWCAQRFPASRYGLILWDHGGGSVSGYGYDEKFASSGSMSLAGLDAALEAAGTQFDFIGFDACLMATVETALTMARHADYLIASEETEPGVGWYYTDWLTSLGKNPSMSTPELGKAIADSFVDTCAAKCPGQLTTLSVIDLAELEHTVPGALTDFSKSTAELIRNERYQTVSNARSGAREFARSSQIDQIDLVHLARNLGTPEAEALAQALLGCVKYNRTSGNMTNAYGLSAYFPYRKAAAADRGAAALAQAGMDASYTQCIRQFADAAASGQAVSGGGDSPLPALMGTLLGGGGGLDPADVTALLGTLLGGRSLDMDNAEQYLLDHRFPKEDLIWTEGEDGKAVLRLSEDAWRLVQDLELNLFYDDGEGYIDLGLDTVYEFDKTGGLIGDDGASWLAIEGQPVAYYHTSTVDDGETYAITGRVPVLHNGVRSELLISFDNEYPHGCISGVQTVYREGETATAAKSLTGLSSGDTIEFLCDYYSYDGTYEDSYLLGDPITVDGALTISDVPLEGETRASYRFTDLYNQHYWTPPVP